MLDTKPKGERRNFALPECYARGLNDCDRVLSREHYVSEKLLWRVARKFNVTGLSWQQGKSTTLTPPNLYERVLCERHNGALSPLDNYITDLYDVLMRWHNGERDISCTLDGENIERWAIKLLLGFGASGHAALGGRRATAREIPEQWLRYVFGEEQLAPGTGFYFLGDTPDVAPDHAKLSFFMIHYDPPDPDAGKVMAIGISMLGFSFATTVLSTMRAPIELYRPSEFVLGDSGVLRFRWQRPNPHTRPIEIDRKANL